MARPLLFALALIAANVQAAATEMAVITLHYARPAVVVAALQSAAGEDVSVRAVDNRLVVSATPERLAEIRRIVADLDREPRTLLISVRTSARQSLSRERYGVGGHWGNDSTRIVVNRHDGGTETHTRVALDRRDRTASDAGSRSVTALEGRTAYIAISDAYPENSYAIGPYGETRLQRDYVPVERGFTVNARVHGNRAVVTLDYRDDRRSPGGAIHTDTAATQISAPLGRWFAVGSVQETVNRGENVILGHGAAASTRSHRIWLKVEFAK